MAAQFTIWDKIRLTADMKETQLTNLAKFISHLIRYLDPVFGSGSGAFLTPRSGFVIQD
jgi:hypothetical protein